MTIAYILYQNYQARTELRIVGECSYEFRDRTGRWPSSMNELQRSCFQIGYTKYNYPNETWGDNVHLVRPPGHLRQTPAENRDLIIAYQKTGKRLWPYRWVCWGDLRTTYVSNQTFESAMALQ